MANEALWRGATLWQLRCEYLDVLKRSGRTALEDWERELQDWRPEDPNTIPSGKAANHLCEWVEALPPY